MPEMRLGGEIVGALEPAKEFSVDLVRRLQPDRMHEAFSRMLLDLVDAWAVDFGTGTKIE